MKYCVTNIYLRHCARSGRSSAGPVPQLRLTPSRRLQLIMSNYSKPVRDFLRQTLHFPQIRSSNKSISSAVRGSRKSMKKTVRCSTKRGSSLFDFEGRGSLPRGSYRKRIGVYSIKLFFLIFVKGKKECNRKH